MKRYRAILVIVLLVATFLTAEWLLKRRTVPPRMVNDLASFLQWRQSPGHIEVFQRSGEEHLIATGCWGGAVLPSGPPGYVFDRSGRLVDWASEMGDDSRFREKWFPSGAWIGKGRALDRNGALQWVAEGGMAGSGNVVTSASSARPAASP